MAQVCINVKSVRIARGYVYLNNDEKVYGEVWSTAAGLEIRMYPKNHKTVSFMWQGYNADNWKKYGSYYYIPVREVTCGYADAMNRIAIITNFNVY